MQGCRNEASAGFIALSVEFRGPKMDVGAAEPLGSRLGEGRALLGLGRFTSFRKSTLRLVRPAPWTL